MRRLPRRLCVYNLRATAISSQQFCLGHLAQSAHTFSGNCSFSAGTNPKRRKNSGLRVSANTRASPWSRAWVSSASKSARPSPPPCRSRQGVGLGRALLEALLTQARDHGLARVFALTRKPEFFLRLGFVPAEKEQFPEKVWADCARCPRQNCCDEIAVALRL